MNTLETIAERAAEIAAKQERLSELLREAAHDGLLMLDPVNFSWFTAGAEARGQISPNDQPALFLQNGSYRWAICSNVDTQRLFDEELDGLGFQVKEWPWQQGNAPLLAELCQNRRVLCDATFGECSNVAERLQVMRRVLSPWDQARLHEIGKLLVHAVEATGRGMQQGDSELEIAGQLGHRLIHRGLEPVAIQVAADNRMRTYRRLGATPLAVQRNCVIHATARRNGLHVTTSRVISFGVPDEQLRREMDVACRWTGAQILASAVGRSIADVVSAGTPFLVHGGFEHEWRLAPLGWITGYAAQENLLVPDDKGRALEGGWAMVWQGSVGAVCCADTSILTADGPQLATPPEYWPLKRIRIGDKSVDRADVLVRE
jgi:Xaa-Pro aminopeptidase